jgi:hypothetical protein
MKTSKFPRTTLIYDLIQRFEVRDGVLRLMSSDITVLEGGHHLLSVAKDWMKVNTNFYLNTTKHYLGYRKVASASSKYQLVLTQRGESLQVSFPHSERVCLEVHQDTLFPYASRTSVSSSEELIGLLEVLFAGK